MPFQRVSVTCNGKRRFAELDTLIRTLNWNGKLDGFLLIKCGFT